MAGDQTFRLSWPAATAKLTPCILEKWRGKEEKGTDGEGPEKGKEGERGESYTATLLLFTVIHPDSSSQKCPQRIYSHTLVKNDSPVS